MDLFDLLEKFFRGIVFFIYNLAETTWTVLRHPIRGPTGLYRRCQRPTSRQLGGLTYLFLILFGCYWLFLRQSADLLLFATAAGPSYRDELSKALKNASLAAPSFSIEAIWPILLGALISTVAIDAVLRLLLRWRLPGRPKHRQAVLAASEYAMLWIVLALMSVWIFLMILPELGRNFSTAAASFLAIVALFCAAASPAATLLGRARRGRSYAETGIRILGLVTLFGCAVYAGFAIALPAQEMRDQSEAAKAMEPWARLKTLRCAVTPDGRIEADGLLLLKDGPPMAFKAADFSLQFSNLDRQPVDSLTERKLEWRRPDAPRFVLLTEGQPQLVELRTRESRPYRGDVVCDLWADRSMTIKGATFDDERSAVKR